MPKYFGKYGGQYVGEVLKPALGELELAYKDIMSSEKFQQEFTRLSGDFIGRPTPLLYAENITKKLGGAQIYLKMEGLANTGAHKINNALGQALLAKMMGKKEVIAETGAGQHGVATAAACAKLGLGCRVFMGQVDIVRQQPNVYIMKQYGAIVIPVTNGSATLKDAVNAALKEWTAVSETTHYLLGSALGPYPYPDIVRDLQAVIGRETRDQLLEKTGKNPDCLIACCGGGSNAIGFFEPFLNDKKVELIAVEAGGIGKKSGQNAARIAGRAAPGIVEGYKSYFLQDADGQVETTHSISAGLDYAGIGPQLADLAEKKRIVFRSATDQQVLRAYREFARQEGILFALESAHAAAEVLKIAPKYNRKKIIVVNVSGRGDKDIFITAKHLYKDEWLKFMKNEIKTMEQDSER